MAKIRKMKEQKKAKGDKISGKIDRYARTLDLSRDKGSSSIHL